MVNNVNTLIGICVNQQQCKHVSVSFSRAAMFMSVLPELQGYVTNVKFAETLREKVPLGQATVKRVWQWDC
jgi:hypothetical protein